MGESRYPELLKMVQTLDWERVHELATELTRQFAPLDMLARVCIQEFLDQSLDDPHLSGTPPWASSLLLYSTPFLVLSSRLGEFQALCAEPFADADDDDCELAAIGPTC